MSRTLPEGSSDFFFKVSLGKPLLRGCRSGPVWSGGPVPVGPVSVGLVPVGRYGGGMGPDRTGPDGGGLDRSDIRGAEASQGKKNQGTFWKCSGQLTI